MSNCHEYGLEMQANPGLCHSSAADFSSHAFQSTKQNPEKTEGHYVAHKYFIADSTDILVLAN